jgi:hypothetical protein
MDLRIEGKRLSLIDTSVEYRNIDLFDSKIRSLKYLCKISFKKLEVPVNRIKTSKCVGNVQLLDFASKIKDHSFKILSFFKGKNKYINHMNISIKNNRI